MAGFARGSPGAWELQGLWGNESWKAFLSLHPGSLLCGMAALKVTQGLERCSAVKRACWEFDSQPPYIGQLTTVTMVPGGAGASSGICRHLQPHTERYK